ncbi:PIN domain-containing protein [Methylomagnum ishizawai]|uniref:PIN domain-containing protein n=1 Tax=Methylomagnum ishizawai TaxID=1760988 RepID=UPI001C339E83|nr:PIN domain-containing protein [Methylomagnum ishizawai]BBL77433.1 ribonuclease VapC [Methylomagnum ishizawai]
MPGDASFLDTNVVLYGLSTDLWRKERVADRLSDGGVLSTQVLAESANVMRRKFGRSVAEIEAFHDILLDTCRVRVIESATIRRALGVAERYGFSIYDSLIVATAMEAGCRTLYSEDMQHGQVIDHRLTIVNPFI